MNHLIPIAAAAVFTAMAGVTHAQEQQSKAEAAPEAQAPAAPEAPSGQPQAAAPTMSPFAMTPALDKTLQATIDVCAACHTEEEMARYESLIGPMMAMLNPMARTNPGGYTAMMMPMMDPNAYAQWMNAYMQKYGTYMDPSKAMTPPGAPAEPKK